MADGTTKIFNINSKKKIVPVLGSHSNSQITYDCVEYMGFQIQYQQKKKWPRILTKDTRIVSNNQRRVQLGRYNSSSKVTSSYLCVLQNRSFPDEIWPTTRLDQANPTGEDRIFEQCTAGHAATVKN